MGPTGIPRHPLNHDRMQVLTMYIGMIHIMNQMGLLNYRHQTLLKKNKILYTNADCFTLSKREELKVIIQESSPDIIGITEVFPKNKLFDNQEIFYQIDNYNLFTANLQEGRGVILYVKAKK